MAKRVKEGPWTHFHDMHSGGGLKIEPYSHIFIEAPQEEAELVFYNRFGRNPHRVTCSCCGEDYSVSEETTLEQATAYHRGCDFAYFRPDGTECEQGEAWKAGVGQVKGYTSRYVERQEPRVMEIRKKTKTTDAWGLYRTLADTLKRKAFSDGRKFLIIRAKEIGSSERRGEMPSPGGWVYQEGA